MPTLAINTLQLRRLKLTDINGIMAIESTAFGRFHWSASAFEQEMSNHLARYWVLTQRLDSVLTQRSENHLNPESLNNPDRIVGYAGYWLVFDEVHITTVAIAEDCRGAGFGELIIAKVLDQAQNHSARTATLEVRRSNDSAQALYTKYGFNILGIRPQYYQDNREDALIMTNDILQTDDFRGLYRQLTQTLFTKLDGKPAGFA